MPSPKAALSYEIHPSMELEDLFLHFFRRFDSLPKPRSVAEARITAIETEGLSLWFSQQWGRPRMWCEDTFQSSLSDGVFASPQEMFGALLLTLASEVCRTSSNEDSVWPAVIAVLKADTVSFPALFVGGQPTTACKNAMAAGARRLQMRNLIDRYGAQEYFDTLKLQFGFTLRGVLRKLPQWLDGLGVPIAVRILTGVESGYGDLKSGSFTDLWKALHNFRRSRSSAEDVSILLRASPWIRPEWAPEVITVAKLRPPRISNPLDPPDVLERSNEAICEMLLHWDYPAKPELFLQLNEEQIYEILGDAETAIFVIDGRVVDRWTAQESGGWRGKRTLPCQPLGAKTNLQPKLLSISSEGKLLREIDLLATGMGEPLLVFDLKLGKQVDLASRLDLSRDYALICDPDLSVPDATPFLKLKDRAVYRLASPWPHDLRVFCDGVLYWQPTSEQREPLRPIRLTVESLPGETGEVGSVCRLNVAGVPEDALVVSLIAAGTTYPTAQQGIYWQTTRPLQVSLGIALGEERLRVRVSGPSYARTVTPKSSLNLRGIACFETGSNAEAEPKWTLLNRNRPLNRSDGAGRARVFAEASRSLLFEGSRFVGEVSPRGLQLKDLYGWGAPLMVCGERQPSTILVESVDDYGKGKFLPPLFKGQTVAYLGWRAPMPLSDEHQILVWPDFRQEPRRLRPNEVSTQNDHALWKLPSLESVAAMAVAYKGVRSASYWVSEPTINALRNARTPGLFALFRWLKLPILSSSFREPMQEAIVQAPAEFVTGWLGAEAVQYGLVHQEAEQGLETVVREFLWNHTERNETRMERLARAFPAEGGGQSEADTFKSSLRRLGEMCPSLSYNLAKYKLRGDKYRKYVRSVAAAMLHEPADSPQLRERLSAACRDCASLIGVAPEVLEADVNAFAVHLDNQVSNYKQVESDLRRLGETSRGRHFITAALLLRLVERNRF